jgi:hypothetical protein
MSAPAHQEAVTLGADVGGKDADAATDEQIVKLRKLLREECQGPYSETVKEFAIVLRIDGSVQSWGKRGVANVVLRRKQQYATADIFVPRETWAEATSLGFREFLAAEVPVAIARLAERAEERNVHVSSDKLSHDVSVAIRRFLST